MSNTTPGRGYAGLLATALLLAYLSAAGICTIYSMLATLYRVYADPLMIGWTVGTYFLVAAAVTAVCGRLGDILGRRRTLLVVLSLGAVGTLLGAFSNGIGQVVAGCALIGMVGPLMPLTMGLVRDALPAEKVPLAIGVLSAVSQGGAGIAILVSGAMIDRFLIPGGFWQLCAIIVLAIACLTVFIPADTPRADGLQGLNLPVGLSFAPAIAGVFIAMQLSRSHGWGDPVTQTVMAVSLLVIVGWIIFQARAAHPLINVRTLGTRQVGLANLMFVLHSLGSMGSTQIGAMLLQQPEWSGIGFGLNATRAGMVMLLFQGIALAGSPWSGHIAARHGPRQAAIAGSVVTLACSVGLVLVRHDFWFFVACMTGLQFGLSMVIPATFNLVVEATPPDRTSEATGVPVVACTTFMGVGSQILFKLMSTSTVGDAGQGSFPGESAYVLCFEYIALMCALAIVVAWALPRRKPAVAMAASAA